MIPVRLPNNMGNRRLVYQFFSQNLNSLFGLRISWVLENYRNNKSRPLLICYQRGLGCLGTFEFESIPSKLVYRCESLYTRPDYPSTKKNPKKKLKKKRKRHTHSFTQASMTTGTKQMKMVIAAGSTSMP